MNFFFGSVLQIERNTLIRLILCGEIEKMRGWKMKQSSHFIAFYK